MDPVACANAVIYLRLSRDDKGKIIESESIKNQRDIVTEFCVRHGYIIVGEFVDDGYSGANFDRPGFNKMLDFIQNSDIRVDIIATKDLSRLGRDMLEADFYAEKYFPEHGITYCAVNDNFDSSTLNYDAPLKLAMNEMYLRDSSRKVKQVLEQKMRRGEYCTCSPYGYMKDAADKSRLVPNPDTCFIVQEIFQLASQGLSTRKIAAVLTEKGYDPPLKYRCGNNPGYKESYKEKVTDVWNETSVKRILRNEVYLGNTILGKSKKVSFKSKKKVKNPRESWYITEGTHEPLVTRDVFDRANLMLGKNTKNWREYETARKSIFNGIVFCESCGGVMNSAGSVYKGERIKYWYLSCNNIPKRSKNHCEHGARIKYSDLCELVKRELNALINLSDSEIEQIIENVKKQTPAVKNYKRSLQQLQKEIDSKQTALKKLYSDYSSGLISDDIMNELRSKFVKEIEALKARVAEYYEKSNTENNDESEKYKRFFKLVKQYTQIDELDSETVRTFIERIEIGPKILPDGFKIANHNTPYRQNIKIFYRFVGELKNSNIS